MFFFFAFNAHDVAVVRLQLIDLPGAASTRAMVGGSLMEWALPAAPLVTQVSGAGDVADPSGACCS